jgi:hypothetical protein
MNSLVHRQSSGPTDADFLLEYYGVKISMIPDSICQSLLERWMDLVDPLGNFSGELPYWWPPEIQYRRPFNLPKSGMYMQSSECLQV